MVFLSFFIIPPKPSLSFSQRIPCSQLNDRLGSPLRTACLGGRLAMVRWLVEECHMDPSELSSDGLAPIHVACVANKCVNVCSYICICIRDA